jgi:hypothetical protein
VTEQPPDQPSEHGYGEQRPSGYGPPPGYGGPPPPGYGGPPPPGWTPPGQSQWGGAPPGMPPPAWGYGAPPPPKPGVLPLRPLGVGEILDGAFSTIRTYPMATLGLSAVISAVSALLQLAVLLPTMSRLETATTELELAETPDPDVFIAAFIAVIVVLVIGTLLAATVLTGMVTIVLGEAVLGRPITIGEAWRRVRPRFWALLGLALLQGLIVMLGFIACIIPGVFLWAKLSLSTPALMLEGRRITDAMRRSSALVRGSWWRVFGILLLASVITMIVGQILRLPFDLFGSTPWAPEGDFSLAGVIAGSVGQIVAGTVTGSIVALVTGVLYVDRRMRAEAFDLTLHAAVQQQGAAS